MEPRGELFLYRLSAFHHAIPGPFVSFFRFLFDAAMVFKVSSVLMRVPRLCSSTHSCSNTLRPRISCVTAGCNTESGRSKATTTKTVRVRNQKCCNEFPRASAYAALVPASAKPTSGIKSRLPACRCRLAVPKTKRKRTQATICFCKVRDQGQVHGDPEEGCSAPERGRLLQPGGRGQSVRLRRSFHGPGRRQERPGTECALAL